MTIEFDYENVTLTEFGLGIDMQHRGFLQVPVDEDVQAALLDMTLETQIVMQKQTLNPEKYQPSEKYAAIEYLILSLDDDLVAELKALHDAVNLPEDASAFNQINECFAYFAKLTDKAGNRITALRRSTQFKTLIKKRHKLIRCVDNTLKVLDDTVFKLDNDFDILIQNNVIHILRPSGLEFAAQLQSAVMAAVPGNIAAIAEEIKFVEFDSISVYAQQHPRAARYIASIKSQSEAHNVSKDKLSNYCRRTNVEVSEVDGKIRVDDSQVMGFLEILDRRRYEIDLVEDAEPEIYRAPSRSRIGQEQSF